MLRGMHRDRVADLGNGLGDYERAIGVLPGLIPAGRRDTLVAQMISSLRRIEYIQAIQRRSISTDRLDPQSRLFDPIKAAAYLGRRGNTNEAVWLTFVATHFGKHRTDEWRLTANVMGSFGQGPTWTATQFGTNKPDFHAMLVRNEALLRDPRQSGRYSNHRQYQSKQPDHIFRTFDTFYDWLFSQGSFQSLLEHVHRNCGQEPTAGFDFMYRMLHGVSGFGRLANSIFLRC